MILAIDYVMQKQYTSKPLSNKHTSKIYKNDNTLYKKQNKTKQNKTKKKKKVGVHF